MMMSENNDPGAHDISRVGPGRPVVRIHDRQTTGTVGAFPFGVVSYGSTQRTHRGVRIVIGGGGYTSIA